MHQSRSQIHPAQRKTPAIAQMSDEFLTYLMEKRGSQLYVVVNREGTSCLRDPGLNQPFSTGNRKYAELVASEAGNGAFVLTLSEALNLLTRNSRK